MDNLKFVTIGGGGGHHQVLCGLKDYKHVNLTALCTVADSGGSSEIFMAEYGLPGYIGDITKCIAGLSEDEVMRSVLLHRFNSPSLRPHSVKNVLMAGLLSQSNMTVLQAIKIMCRMFGVNERHMVMPASVQPATLNARLSFGQDLVGEKQIDKIASNPLWHPDIHAIQKVWLEPAVTALPEAVEAVVSADRIIICPGDMFTSIIPVLLVNGITAAIRERQAANIIMVLNIMTKAGETDGYGAADFVSTLEQYLSVPVSTVLYNNAPIPDQSIFQYRLEQKRMVQPPSDSSSTKTRWVGKDLWRLTSEGFVYHDPEKLAAAIMEL